MARVASALRARSGRAGRGMLAYFAGHRTMPHLLMLVLLVFGAVSAGRITAQFFPDVASETVAVSIAWPGAGAESVDSAILARIEPALMAIDNVLAVTSVAREGQAQLYLDFEPGTDLVRAEDAVEAALGQISDLPEDAEPPDIRADEWTDRVTDVVITGPVGIDQLARIADDFTAALYQDGVTKTTVQGIATPEVTVEVATEARLRHDLTLEAVAAAIRGAAEASPLGNVADGSARLNGGADLADPVALSALVLRRDAAGGTLTLGDVATITAQPVDAERASFVGVNPAMTIRVDRDRDGDAIAIQALVAAAAERVEQGLPPGVDIDLVRTRADMIADRMWLLIDNGLMGLVLVLILLFLFLNARAALWVAAGIPVSLLTGIGLMELAGLSLNMISLFALIITLGIVVDDAIVVAEHADYRARHLGEPPDLAALRGAERMAAPVIASTLTTVIAFTGLLVVGGNFGGLIADIPITVSAVLLASLVECFLILPNHMRHALTPGGTFWRIADRPSVLVNRGVDVFNDRVTRPMVRLVIALRYPALAGALCLMAVSMAQVIRGDVPFRFFNAPEQPAITANFLMLPGATRDDSLAMIRELQRATETVAARYAAEHGADPVAYALAQVGGNMGRGLSGSETRAPDAQGALSIELIDPDLRPYSSLAFAADLEAEVVPHPLLEELSLRGARFGPGGQSLEVELLGLDPAALDAAAEDLKSVLAAEPVVSGLEDSLTSDATEWTLALTPAGQALGLDAAAIFGLVRDHLSGIVATRFAAGPRSGEIRVIAPEAERGANLFETYLVRTAPGVFVPLSDLVTRSEDASYARIERSNGARVVIVSGDVSEDDPDAAAAMEERLERDILPALAARHAVDFRFAGQKAEERKFLSEAALGFGLCLLGIYLCLAWISASWLRPVIVMSVIPFGVIGAIWGHALWDMPLSIFSIVGLVGMAGIIINDAIVLVSTIEDYRRDRALRQALTDAVVNRLRPVFLTSATTIAGLAPLLAERSSQAEFLKPTVLTLVFGLGVGFFLVLLLVPAALAIEGDIVRAIRSLRRAVVARAGRAQRAASGIRKVALAAVAGVLAIMAPYVATGALPDALAWTAPRLAAAAPGAHAALLASGYAALLCAAAWLILRRRPRGAG